MRPLDKSREDDLEATTLILGEFLKEAFPEHKIVKIGLCFWEINTRGPKSSSLWLDGWVADVYYASEKLTINPRFKRKDGRRSIGFREKRQVSVLDPNCHLMVRKVVYG